MSLSWLWLIPESLKRFIVHLDLRDPSIPECVIESAMELFSSTVIRNMLYLLNDSLKIVKFHDDSLFRNEYRNRIILFYGASDKWIPKELAEKQEERLGKSSVFVDENGCDHAFVNCDGEVMAQIVFSFVREFFIDVLS
uniref:Lipid droplet-associated hydrolase n=1 Tax=Panagrolaimus sp. ES5 TaxID=591445 RepID=A0AC34GK10_9BILA